jgi:hypothetical protein
VVSPLHHQATLNGLCYKTHTRLHVGISNSAPLPTFLYLLALIFFFSILLYTIILHYRLFVPNAQNVVQEADIKKCFFVILFLDDNTIFRIPSSSKESTLTKEKKKFSHKEIIHLGIVAEIHKM